MRSDSAENTRHLLPPAGVWRSAADVEQYACSCMQLCGLADWSFGWDRSVKRLGCCKMTRRSISLSRHFVAAYLERDPELIRRTILHELAHALAWLYQRERVHGPAWRSWCAALGIAGEKATCKCDAFGPADLLKTRARYALCHCETGEVYRYYTRRPSIPAHKLARYYIPGKKDATLGKLCLISLPQEGI